MGSLMSGWDSRFQDPNTVKRQRNKSLTREEIDSFWQSMKQNETIEAGSPRCTENQENMNQRGGERFQRSLTVPLTNSREIESNFNSSTEFFSDQHHFHLEKCWWTRSSSAFLNEEPVESMESPTYKYASQYNLTSSSSSPFSRKLESSGTT